MNKNKTNKLIKGKTTRMTKAQSFALYVDVICLMRNVDPQYFAGRTTDKQGDDYYNYKGQ